MTSLCKLRRDKYYACYGRIDGDVNKLDGIKLQAYTDCPFYKANTRTHRCDFETHSLDYANKCTSKEAILFAQLTEG